MILVTKQRYNLIKKCNEGLQIQNNYYKAPNYNIAKKFIHKRQMIAMYLKSNGFEVMFKLGIGYNFEEIKRKLINENSK